MAKNIVTSVRPRSLERNPAMVKNISKKLSFVLIIVFFFVFLFGCSKNTTERSLPLEEFESALITLQRQIEGNPELAIRLEIFASEEVKKEMEKLRQEASIEQLLRQKKTIEDLQKEIAFLQEQMSTAPGPGTKKEPAAAPTRSISNSILIEDLTSTNPRTAEDAAYRLIRRAEAVEELIKAYEAGNDTMKKRVLWCITRMGEPARLKLNEIVANPSNWEPRIVAAAREILENLEDKEPVPAVPITAAPTTLPADDISMLIQQLKEEPGPIAKQAAANNLVKRKGEAVPKLVEALSDKCARERVKWCLMKIGEPAIDTLVDTGFASSDPDIREVAISTVVSIGGQKARDKLTEAASDTGKPRVMYSAWMARERLVEKEMEKKPEKPTSKPPAEKAAPAHP